MSVDIKLKHSAVAGKKPDPGQLQNGELALNTKDVKAYIKDSDGNVVQIAGKDMPDNDSRYVQVTGDDMTGDLTLGTDKITLGASDGSATFAGDVRIKSYVDAGATAYNNTAIFGSNNDNSNATLVVQNYSTNGDIFVGRSSSSDKVVEISNSGSATFAGNTTVGSNTAETYLSVKSNGESTIYAINSYDGKRAVFTGTNKDAVYTSHIYNDGSATLAGDVAIGDSTTFLGTIGDALALLPNSIVDQFKTVIDGLPKAKPYGATTLPADLPTPLKDALVRVTTAGKINLNSDGSASLLGQFK